jgi:hypothetical protein
MLRRFRRPRAVQQARSVQQVAARRRYAHRTTGGRVTAVAPVKPHPHKGG